jgi:hypothetical protein
MMKRTLVPALVLAAAAAAPATSNAEVTGNIGFVTDYIFRGIFQSESSAYAGADLTSENGFYLGTWWADVGIGTETDIYAGWQGGGDSMTFKIGYTGYRYLDDFDGDYDEINLGLYAGIFALDVAVGQYDGDKFFSGDPVAGGNQDYIFTSVTLTPEMGPYYKVGMWSGDYVDNILSQAKSGNDDPDGIYFEIGYSYEIEDHGIVFSAALDWSSDLIVGPFSNGSGELPDYALTFGIKKNLGGE